MFTHNFVFPDWQHSIVNLAATWQQYLGKTPRHATIPALTKVLSAHHYQNIVYFVVDGMGSRVMAKHLPENSYLRRHQTAELTSVFPSATTVATTALLSGLTPAEHGWLGWTVDFNGSVIELFPNRSYVSRLPLPEPDFAKHHLPYEYIFRNQTKAADYTIMPDKVYCTVDATTNLTYHNWRGMTKHITNLCHQPGEKFIYCYNYQLDGLMHCYGPSSRHTKSLLRKIDRSLAKLVRSNPNTLFVVTADHGQIDLQGTVNLYQDQAVLDCLAHPPALEARGMSFKLKPGMTTAFQHAMQKYAADFVLFPTKTLIDYSVFGTFDQHQYQQLLGDFIAVGTQTNKMLVYKPDEAYTKNHPTRGQHGGLTPEEMYVPLIIAGQPE